MGFRDSLGRIRRALLGHSEPAPPAPPAQPARRPPPEPVAARPRDRAPGGKPADFFPMAIGTTWTYTVDVLGDALYYKQMAWPNGNGTMGVVTRGRFAVPRNRSYQLALSIIGKADVQGPLKEPGGVQLSVTTDELGVYEGFQQLFWSTAQNTRFVAREVVVYDPNHHSAPHVGGGQWGSWNAAPGYSLRPIFFGDRPGTGLGLGEKGQDLLIFNGPDHTKSPEWQGADILHFIRRVKAAEEGNDELSKSFEEHMWYAFGKGLVELRQFIEGVETMRWKLTAFEGREHR